MKLWLPSTSDEWLARLSLSLCVRQRGESSSGHYFRVGATTRFLGALSPLRNPTPKKWDMNGHLISSMLADHNCMGIPVKKRDMNAIHPLS